MSPRSTPASSFPLAATFLFAALLAIACRAHGQIFYQDQEVLVRNLPSVTARSQDPSDILLASLETVFHDQDVCCGKNSALHDRAVAADSESLKDVAAKLEGRHLLSDGRPIKVTAEYWAPDAINAGHVIGMIVNQHGALMEWNSRLYVVYGVVYRWIESGDRSSGTSAMTVIHKLLLWDPRFSDSRREVVFDRTTDELSEVQGMLFLQAAPQ